jgi:hypothetical protein
MAFLFHQEARAWAFVSPGGTCVRIEQQVLESQVREAASILDIDILYYPCPKGGPTWRPKVCNLVRARYMSVCWSECFRHAFMVTDGCLAHQGGDAICFVVSEYGQMDSVLKRCELRWKCSCAYTFSSNATMERPNTVWHRL